jgi:hypothetical protein
MDLIDGIEDDIASFTAASQRSWRCTCESRIHRDAAYDTIAIYAASAAGVPKLSFHRRRVPRDHDDEDLGQALAIVQS